MNLQAANDNIHPDEPMRLADAVKYGFPHGGMTVTPALVLGLSPLLRLSVRKANRLSI
jgi:geranylgeranyl pyrophosphate synthase